MPHVELPQAEFKVVVLGDTKVGKTSLVLRFTEGYYRDNSRSPTVGAFFLTKRVQTSSGITAKVQIWDTAGQAQFRKMAPIYWRDSAAILLCYDVGNIHSWNVALEWLKDLRHDPNVLQKNIVLALVANKSDLLNRRRSRHDEYGSGYDDQQEMEESSMVPLAQVEQVLQAMNHNVSGGASAHTSNNNSTNNNISAAASIMTPAPHGYQQGSGSGNGQVLHVHTSARKDENVELVFQKVAEEVLFVREQERTAFIYGGKYKHYSTSTSPITPSLGDVISGGDGKNDFDFLHRNTMSSVTPVHGKTPNSLMAGDVTVTPTNNYGIQSNYSPTANQLSNHHQVENQNTRRSLSGGGVHENKENQYDSSRTIVDTFGSRDKYNTPQEDDDNIDIIKYSTSRDHVEKVSSQEFPVGAGLCYAAGCGSPNPKESDSDSCTIS